MSQHIHDSNFLSNLLSILRFDGPDKFCREARTWRFLHHPPYSPVSTFAQFLQYFVSMIKQLSIFHFHYSSFERWLEFWKCQMFHGFSSLHTKYLILVFLYHCQISQARGKSKIIVIDMRDFSSQSFRRDFVKISKFLCVKARAWLKFNSCNKFAKCSQRQR